MEVDYIIIIVAEVDLDANPNEVRDTRYVSPEELKEMLKQPGKPIKRCSILTEDLQFTPWFRLICQKFLFEWWNNLDNLDKFINESQIIHRMI
jgi:isopentenyl-diphosphate delta-isomerase